MRFEHACEGWQNKRLTQEQAAQLLGVCARSFRRYIDRYELKSASTLGLWWNPRSPTAPSCR